jgi:hypothetical protein
VWPNPLRKVVLKVTSVAPTDVACVDQIPEFQTAHSWGEGKAVCSDGLRFEVAEIVPDPGHSHFKYATNLRIQRPLGALKRVRIDSGEVGRCISQDAETVSVKTGYVDLRVKGEESRDPISVTLFSNSLIRIKCIRGLD